MNAQPPASAGAARRPGPARGQCAAYMRDIFDDWRAQGITSINFGLIADSNHGSTMIGVGGLVAAELTGEPQELLAPFRLSRFARGALHPTSHSPFPWS